MSPETREDMAGTLMAISVVTKSLADRLVEIEEGEKDDGNDEAATTTQ